MLYLTSDIHGEYEMFLKMLELINFSDTDILYILGDVVDRGPEPIKILQYIIDKKNIKMLMGNHEKMMLDALILSKDEFGPTYASRLWMRNGGFVTADKFLSLPLEEQKKIYDYVKNLPLFYVLDKNILIHAGIPIGDEVWEPFVDEDDAIKCFNRIDKEFLLWDRDMHKYDDGYIEGYHLWCGHTPTLKLQNNNGIFHKKGFSVIDGGACFPTGALNCICLDNMKEFKIENNRPLF